MKAVANPHRRRSTLRLNATNFFPIPNAEADIFRADACCPPADSIALAERAGEDGRVTPQAAIAIPSMSFLREIVHCKVTGWPLSHRPCNAV